MRGELAASAGTLRTLAVLLLPRAIVCVPVSRHGLADVEASPKSGGAVLAPQPLGPDVSEVDGINGTRGDFEDQADLERRNWITEALFGCVGSSAHSDVVGRWSVCAGARVRRAGARPQAFLQLSILRSASS